ncbi:MAG TPA: hypothetical protein VFP63_03035 [Dehalococcoidia bacterium]|nr:hypothetical protein [Dehalococcoidia bacterium]
MKRAAGLLLTLTLVLAGLACGGDDDSDNGPTDGGSTTEVVRERDGVRMTLSVDRETYSAADPVRVTLKVENTTDLPVEYRGQTPAESGLTVTVASDLADPQALLEPGPEDVSGTLAAGDTIERTLEWDKVIDMNVTPVTAPPGNYTVNAAFMMAREGFADLAELGAAVTFEVEGTPYIQPPVEVVRAMINDEQVKAWGQGRGDNVICAYPPHGYFYNAFFVTGQAAETFDFLYDSQVNNGLPICGIATEGEAWRLVLYSPKGEEPHRLSVYIALDEPVVLRVVEGGPTPAPTATP